MSEIEPTPDVGGLNAAWRGGLIAGLSGMDLRDIAARFGVNVRTVQRWVTSAGEQRNPFPANLDGKPLDEWPEGFLDRLEFTRNVTQGWTRGLPEGTPTEKFTERFRTITEAEDYMRRTYNGEVDPWLSATVVSMKMRRDGDQWVVDYEYQRDLYEVSKLSGVELADLAVEGAEDLQFPGIYPPTNEQVLERTRLVVMTQLRKAQSARIAEIRRKYGLPTQGTPLIGEYERLERLPEPAYSELKGRLDAAAAEEAALLRDVSLVDWDAVNKAIEAWLAYLRYLSGWVKLPPPS